MFDESWEDRDIPENVKADCGFVLSALKYLKLTPEMFEKEMESMIKMGK